MMEIHVALFVALLALYIAWNRQRQLPSYRLQWPEIRTNCIYTNRLVVEQKEAKKDRDKAFTIWVDQDGRATFSFPPDYIEAGDYAGEHYQVSMKFERGANGFHVGFYLDPPEITEPPSRFVTIGLSPGNFQMVDGKMTRVPPRLSILDGSDTLIAGLP